MPFRRGNHVCVVYETPEEQVAIAAEFIAEGLRQQERCLYAAESQTALQQFRDALAARGIDVGSSEAGGALWLRTTDAAHLIDGHFDAERMLRMLNDMVEDTLDAGFTGLRTCGDMSWLLHDAPGSSQVVEYEALCNQFFASAHALGMCQYDRRRLPEGVLCQALATHTSVLVDRRHTVNPFYQPWPFDVDRLTESGPARWKLDQLRSTES